MLEAAAAARAEHADAVGVVEHEPRVVALAQAEQRGQGRDVAVHAEHGIGGDDAHVGLRGGEPALEAVQVEVGVARVERAREARAVVQAGMVQAIAEDLAHRCRPAP